jgi:hypothetical protein
VLSLVTFFAQAKKVTRSPAGRVEALHLNGRTKDEQRHWIPACAGMTNKKSEMDSRLRGNDGEKKNNGSAP